MGLGAWTGDPGLPRVHPGPSAKRYNLRKSSSSRSTWQVPQSKNSYWFFKPWFKCHHLWEAFPKCPYHSLHTFPPPLPQPNLSLLPLSVKHTTPRSHSDSFVCLPCKILSSMRAGTCVSFTKHTQSLVVWLILCLLDRATGCPDIWSNIITGVTVRAFLDGFNILDQ